MLAHPKWEITSLRFHKNSKNDMKNEKYKIINLVYHFCLSKSNILIGK